METNKKTVSLGDRATYFYIKNIKKWMFCPACKNGKMTFKMITRCTVWAKAYILHAKPAVQK